MIPIFKSNCSIGKSILTLDDPSKTKDGSADSIISIAVENGLSQLFLVEDSMIGFIEAFTKCKENNIQLVFGLRISCSNDRMSEDKNLSHSKIVIFAKNDEGLKTLTKIYSLANTESQGFVDSSLLKKHWNSNVLMAIPFYDSFIYNNNFKGSLCVADFEFANPILFVEENDLPFDHILQAKVEKWAQINNSRIEKVKSIYYKDRKDFEAWQTYKCLCNRSFGKQQSLSSPNLEHCGSDSFCWEAFKENER
jgi:DNA polymerase III alpha subunit